MHFIYDFCILSMFFLVNTFNKYSFEMLKQRIELKSFQNWEIKSAGFYDLMR